MSLSHFPTFEHFKRCYGDEPHLGCYLVYVYRPYSEPWQIRLIIEGVHLREVTVAIASKRQLTVWCRKSMKLMRWNMRQIIGEAGLKV